LIAVRRAPDRDEQQMAHDRICKLVEHHRQELAVFIDGLSRTQPVDFQEPHLVYPRKFLPETWEFLEEAELVGRHSSPGGRETTAAIALSMMVILADCMAGEERLTVTDRSEAYGALSGFLAAEAGVPPATTLEGMHQASRGDLPTQPSDALEHLALLSLRVIDVGP